MVQRRNEFDVTNQIETTNPEQVADAVCDIYRDLYQFDSPDNLGTAFLDVARLYRGEMPGYHSCDTDYHDIQHVLDVTLAMARLMDGCARATSIETIPEHLFRFGVVTALFHDCGYIRLRKDSRHENGAEYTKVHVSRGARFLEDYLPKIGMGEMTQAAMRTIHFTGYEVPVDKIRVAPEYRLIGNLLGSADILAQMADRCYLEKCYDRLYPEFVRGGIARQRRDDGSEIVVFSSAADLIFKTPRFYTGAIKSLDRDLDAQYRCIEGHLGGYNPYLEEVGKNIRYARYVSEKEDISILRRKPPSTVGEPAAAQVQPRLI